LGRQAEDGPLQVGDSQPVLLPCDLRTQAVLILAGILLGNRLEANRWQAAADFRGHRIPAGFNTLRYDLMPNDGNHLGAAPNRDFLLVVPAASDGDPGATFKFQELVTMSARTTGTKHPSPLSLVQADAEPSTPAVSKDDQDHWTFSGGMRLSSGEELPLALVVKETAQQ